MFFFRSRWQIAAMHHLRDWPNHWLRVTCACGRSSLIPVSMLAERHGPGARLTAITARLRCSTCRAKPATADLTDQPGGLRDFYAETAKNLPPR